MNPDSPFVIGIAPEHGPALLAALALPLVAWGGSRLVHAGVLPLGGRIATAYRDYATAPTTLRWLTWLLLATAAIHLGLPLGHAEGGTGLLFLGSGVAYGWLALRALAAQRYRGYTAGLLAGTLIAYLVVVGSGTEEPDHVGIATALIELAALGLCIVPARGARRFARGFASTALVAGTVVTGAVIWVGSFVAHERGPGALGHGREAGPGSGPEAGEGNEHGGEHGHAFTARAQAGVVMRPVHGAATRAQQHEAEELAAATAEGIAKYRDLRRAQRDGYRAVQLMQGLAVHLENKAYQSDGRILDPDRPEQLVYAIENGSVALLGAVYQMQTAGVPGPAVGGPITRWHAHNVCITITPPGFGVVSAFGTCPSLTLTVTMPGMMHVWTVEQPGGPYAEEVDAVWARRELVRSGRPFPA